MAGSGSVEPFPATGPHRQAEASPTYGGRLGARTRAQDSRRATWRCRIPCVHRLVCGSAPSSLMGQMETGKEAWRAVRRRRASPPGLAAERDDRRSVFQSSLAQAEELWDAAAAVGPASRPLPLYYCVSQVGRAVCASWTLEGDWRPRAHGLRRVVPDDPEPAARALAYSASLENRPNGAFGMIASATRSTTFAGEASVAQFWASLPGFPTPRPVFGDIPRCLTIEQVRVSGPRR